MSMQSPTPKRLRPSIRLDVLMPGDYFKYDFRGACEDCSHFEPSTESCTLRFNTEPHLRRNQEASYLLTGKRGLCRFLEID